MTASRLVFDEKVRVAEWVAERIGHYASWGDYYAMGAELNGDLVSGVVVTDFTDSNASAHIAVSKPTKLLPELIAHTCLYAFGQLELRRLTGFVEAENEKALRLNKKIGFVEEGVMRQAGTGGQDIIILVLWPENVRKGRLNG
jgi:RimJ/RimL family protein N-acetyltransferase